MSTSARIASALLAVNETGCKLPHDWLVMLSIDLATFCGI